MSKPLPSHASHKFPYYIEGGIGLTFEYSNKEFITLQNEIDIFCNKNSSIQDKDRFWRWFIYLLIGQPKTLSELSPDEVNLFVVKHREWSVLSSDVTYDITENIRFSPIRNRSFFLYFFHLQRVFAVHKLLKNRFKSIIKRPD